MRVIYCDICGEPIIPSGNPIYNLNMQNQDNKGYEIHKGDVCCKCKEKIEDLIKKIEYSREEWSF